MPRILIEGWESGSFDKWDSVTSYANSMQTPVKDGLTGIYCVTNCNLAKVLPARDSHHVSIRTRAEGSSEFYLYFRNGATTMGTFKIAFGNYAYIYKGTGTLLATSVALMGLNKTYKIDVYYKPKTDSSGIFQVKINGFTDANLDFTGQTSDTAAQIDTLQVAPSNSCYLDDLVVDDADWVGNTRIQGLVPNADGATSDWTPSAGSNYQCVDEIPPSDSDYVSTDVADKVDSYGLSDLVGYPITIKAVCVSVRAKQDGAASVQNIQLGVRSGGNDYFSSDIPVPQDLYTRLMNIWEVNPNTSAAFTTSEVNALEAKIKART
jgi:hypothetical protein